MSEELARSLERLSVDEDAPVIRYHACRLGFDPPPASDGPDTPLVVSPVHEVIEAEIDDVFEAQAQRQLEEWPVREPVREPVLEEPGQDSSEDHDVQSPQTVPGEIRWVGDDWAQDVVRGMGNSAESEARTPGSAPDQSPPTPSRPRRTTVRARDAASPAGVPTSSTTSAAWVSVLASLLQEFGINWLLFSGVTMVAAAGLLLAVRHWSDMGVVGRYLCVLGTTSGLYGLGLATSLGMKLKQTPRAFMGLVLFFIPLNLVAMRVMGLAGTGQPVIAVQWVTAIVAMALLLFMGCSGTRAILDLHPLSLAPGLLLASSGALVAGGGPFTPMTGSGIGLLLAILFLARQQVLGPLDSLASRGLVPLVLAVFAAALLGTGLQMVGDWIDLGLVLLLLGHLIWETGYSLRQSHPGDADAPGGSRVLDRSLALSGEVLLLVAFSLIVLPRPFSNPLILLAGLHLLRVMYLSFAAFRDGFQLLFLVPGPVILALFAPHCVPEIGKFLSSLAGSLGLDGWGRFAINLSPIVLAAPLQAHMAVRLARRGSPEPGVLLHSAGAMVALSALVITSPFPKLGLLAAGLSGILWMGLALLHRFQYMVVLSSISSAMVLVEGLRIMGAPPWSWVSLMALIALGLLLLHQGAVARDLGSFDPFLCGSDPLLRISESIALGGLFVYGYALFSTQLSVETPGWHLGLTLEILYFVAHAWVDFQLGLALVPTALLMLEVAVLCMACGLDQMLGVGGMTALVALIPLAVARLMAHGSDPQQGSFPRWLPPALALPKLRSLTLHFHARMAQIAALAAFVLPPYADGPGAMKGITVAVVYGLMAGESVECMAFSLFSFGVAIHASVLTRITNPGLDLGYQILDVLVGLLLIGGSARPSWTYSWRRVAQGGGLAFMTLSTMFFLGPAAESLWRHPIPLWISSCACLAQACLGVLAIVFARRIGGEVLVYLGEVSLALVYLRLLTEGMVAPTLVMAFLALAGAFILQVAGPRFLAEPEFEVYRRPARLTAHVLPLLALARGYGVGGATGTLLILGAAVYYHLAAAQLREHGFLVFSMVLYNLAGLVAPAGPPWLHGSRYLIPLGLTFLAYSHASYLGRSREINFWRLLGVTLLYADILPRAIFVSGSLAPRFLTLIMCVGVGFPGVLFRTQLYLLAGTGLMLITLGAIVIREIFEVTQRGLLSLLFLGLFLILLAAIFEGARERLQHSLARLQERFGDWD